MAAHDRVELEKLTSSEVVDYLLSGVDMTKPFPNSTADNGNTTTKCSVS